PDAGGAPVPDRVRGRAPVLLAARLGEVVRVVLGAHDEQVVGAVGDERGDVERERGVAALVLADEVSVDPHPGSVVDGAEVQQDHGCAVAAAGGGQVVGGDRAGVPDHGVETGLADPGGGRLGR